MKTKKEPARIVSLLDEKGRALHQRSAYELIKQHQDLDRALGSKQRKGLCLADNIDEKLAKQQKLRIKEEITKRVQDGNDSYIGFLEGYARGRRWIIRTMESQ